MKTLRIIICLALVAGITGLMSCKEKSNPGSESQKTPNIEDLLTELSSSQDAVNAEKTEFLKLLDNPNCDKGKLENAERRFSAALKDYYFNVQAILELDKEGKYKDKCDEALKNYEELFKLIEKSRQIREGK